MAAAIHYLHTIYTYYLNIIYNISTHYLLFVAQDADKLGGGYVLVFLYVNLMLSKLNFVQQRFWLSVVGILR